VAVIPSRALALPVIHYAPWAAALRAATPAWVVSRPPLPPHSCSRNDIVGLRPGSRGTPPGTGTWEYAGTPPRPAAGSSRCLSRSSLFATSWIPAALWQSTACWVAALLFGAAPYRLTVVETGSVAAGLGQHG
jgi:hypothetical protein